MCDAKPDVCFGPKSGLSDLFLGLHNSDILWTGGGNRKNAAGISASRFIIRLRSQIAMKLARLAEEPG